MNQVDNKSNPRAFSLIEVIMALAVLSLGLLGIMRLAASNLNTTTDSRDQIIAAALVQDALETIFNIKDNNKINGAAHQFVSFPTSVFQAPKCRIDYTYSFIQCNILVPPVAWYRLYYHPVNGFVISSLGATPTKFFRRIVIQGADNTGALDRTVTAYVSWNGAAPNIASCDIKNKCVSAQMTLTSN